MRRIGRAAQVARPARKAPACGRCGRQRHHRSLDKDLTAIAAAGNAGRLAGDRASANQPHAERVAGLDRKHGHILPGLRCATELDRVAYDLAVFARVRGRKAKGNLAARRDCPCPCDDVAVERRAVALNPLPKVHLRRQCIRQEHGRIAQQAHIRKSDRVGDDAVICRAAFGRHRLGNRQVIGQGLVRANVAYGCAVSIAVLWAGGATLVGGQAGGLIPRVYGGAAGQERQVGRTAYQCSQDGVGANEVAVHAIGQATGVGSIFDQIVVGDHRLACAVPAAGAVGDDGVAQMQDAVIVVDAAAARGAVGGESAALHYQRVNIIIDAAAVVRGAVARKGAVLRRQCAKFVVDAAAVAAGAVAGEGAVSHRQHGMIVADAAAKVGAVVGESTALNC